MIVTPEFEKFGTIYFLFLYIKFIINKYFLL